MSEFTLKEVEALCGLMVRYGLCKLSVEGVSLERPLHVIPPPDDGAPKKDEPPALDDFDQVKKLDPDAQDAALMLAPTRGR